MSLAEVKASISAMTVEERLEVAAWITHLNRNDDPRYQAELDRRIAAMNAGHRTTQAELEQRHRDLTARGQ